ncbi:MAG: shikimate dehydrogenase [Coleofasciculaceae cyanobacterium]
MQLIKGTTKLLGVIGNPIEHSLSPLIHNAAIAALGVDYVYLPMPVKIADLSTAIAGFKAIGIEGFSVTIPHKQTILSFLSEVSEVAKIVGAVNTVWRTDNGWHGTNTDVEGFIAPLQKYERDWSQITPLILGYGGAARAVVVGLSQLGCKEVNVVGRDVQKLNQFQQSWMNVIPMTVNIHLWSELPSLISQTDLVVNATPIGMYPNVEDCPIDAEVMQLKAGAIAYDLIYTPNPTQFLKIAKQQNAIAIDGLEMLVQQGVAAFKIWVGEAPPVDIMRQVLQQHLGL